MSTPPAKPPEILDKIVDVVLAHRPKPTTKATKKRKRKAKEAGASSSQQPGQKKQTSERHTKHHGSP